MVDIASLVAVCQLVISGGNKAIKEIAKKKLTETEKELMTNAAKNGEFYVLSADGVPNWVRIERKNFMDTNDPLIATKYLDAFKSLCERGYIYPDSGILFRLTSNGFEKARKLTPQ